MEDMCKTCPIIAGQSQYSCLGRNTSVSALHFTTTSLHTAVMHVLRRQGELWRCDLSYRPMESGENTL